MLLLNHLKKDKIHIVDPAKGKYKLTKQQFNEIWTNIAVLVKKTESFNSRDESPSYMNIFTDIFKRTIKH